jgi:hypothetical protein
MTTESSLRLAAILADRRKRVQGLTVALRVDGWFATRGTPVAISGLVGAAA